MTRRDVKEARAVPVASSGRTVSSNDIESATSSENGQKTLHWLQSSLAEMKGEILDLNRSVNVSRQLQQQQEAAGQLQLTRSDVTALQAQVADAAAHRQQINQSIQQVHDDVQRLDQHQQLNAAQLERIENNVSRFFFISLASASQPTVVVCVRPSPVDFHPPTKTHTYNTYSKINRSQ